MNFTEGNWCSLTVNSNHVLHFWNFEKRCALHINSIWQKLLFIPSTEYATTHLIYNCLCTYAHMPIILCLCAKKQRRKEGCNNSGTCEPESGLNDLLNLSSVHVYKLRNMWKIDRGIHVSGRSSLKLSQLLYFWVLLVSGNSWSIYLILCFQTQTLSPLWNISQKW